MFLQLAGRYLTKHLNCTTIVYVLRKCVPRFCRVRWLPSGCISPTAVGSTYQRVVVIFSRQEARPCRSRRGRQSSRRRCYRSEAMRVESVVLALVEDKVGRAVRSAERLNQTRNLSTAPHHEQPVLGSQSQLLAERPPVVGLGVLAFRSLKPPKRSAARTEDNPAPMLALASRKRRRVNV